MSRTTRVLLYGLAAVVAIGILVASCRSVDHTIYLPTPPTTVTVTVPGLAPEDLDRTTGP